MANELVVEINGDDSGLQESLGDLKSNLAIVSQSLMDLGSDMKDAFMGALDGVFETQKGMLKFQNQTGSSAKEMVKYGTEIKNLYRKGIGESIGDVGEAMAIVKQQSKQMGISSSKDLKNVTENALVLRDTFDVDLESSTKTVGTLMKNFGMTSKEAFNYIAKGFQDGLNQSGDFMDTIYEYSPAFAKIGMDADDMFNILKSGSQAGIFTVDKMGDAVKEFGIRAIDGSDATKEAFKSIGLDADLTAKKFAEGGTAGQKAFFDVLQGLNTIKDPIKREAMGVSLFGTMWEDLGGKALINLGKVKDATEKYAGTMDKIKKNNATKDMALQWTQLKRTIEIDVVQPLAAKLLPALKAVADAAKIVMPILKDAFASVPAPVVILAAALAGLATVIVPLIGLWGMLAPAIAAIKVAFVAVSGAIAGISLPLVLVIAGIVALLAIVYVFRDKFMSAFQTIASVVMPILTAAFNYMKSTFMSTIMPIINEQLPKIKYAFMEAFTSIQANLQTVLPFIIALIGGMKPVFLGIGAVLKVVWDSFLIVFGGIISFLGSTVVNIISIIKGLITMIVGIVNIGLGILSGDWSRAWQGVTSLLAGIWDLIKGLISQGMNLIKVTIGNGLNVILGLFNRIFPGISNTVRQVWSSITGAFKNGANIVKNTVSSMLKTIGRLFSGSNFKAVGKKLIDQLVSGIKAGISAVKNACKSVSDAISNFFPHSPAKEGALRTFPKVGGTLMEQLIDGIEGSQSKLQAVTANVASDINGNINTSVSTDNSNNASGITVPVYLDGKKISEVVAPYFVRALRQQGY